MPKSGIDGDGGKTPVSGSDLGELRVILRRRRTERFAVNFELLVHEIRGDVPTVAVIRFGAPCDRKSSTCLKPPPRLVEILPVLARGKSECSSRPDRTGMILDSLLGLVLRGLLASAADCQKQH